MTRLAFEALERAARERRAEFSGAAPFPHLVIDGLLPPEIATALAAEFDAIEDGWIYYHHVNERKRGFNDVTRMGTVSREVVTALNAAPFVGMLQRLTGVDGLRADPTLDGGGLQESRAGGFVNVHTDFLSHPTQRTWTRRVNLLLFLNDAWPASYGGELELWDDRGRRCVRAIAPLFNRCVIFETSARAFHGVPTPIACPPERGRRALALYYFTDDGRARRLRPTRYVPRPGDPLATRALIRLDGWLLYAYAVLKRYTPFGDRLATKLLKRL